MSTATAPRLDVYSNSPKKTYRILWFADEERDCMWNQHWADERDAWADSHEVQFWGHGRPGWHQNITGPELARGLFDGEMPDLVVFSLYFLCLPPKCAGQIDAPKVCFIEDNYPQVVTPVADFVERHRIDCLWHRYYTGFTTVLAGVKNRIDREPASVGVPWAVDPNVFCPSTTQPHDVSLMGQFTRRYYPIRNDVFKLVLQAKNLGIVHRPHPTAFRPRGHRRHKLPNSVIGTAYAEALASAKTGITTGGAVGYPIARHFEIPACGSALICPTSWELQKKGFRPGVHHYELDADDPVGQVRHVLENEADRQKLVRNSRAFVLERHTWENRVMETVAAMEQKGILT